MFIFLASFSLYSKNTKNKDKGSDKKTLKTSQKAKKETRKKRVGDIND